MEAIALRDVERLRGLLNNANPQYKSATCKKLCVLRSATQSDRADLVRELIVNGDACVNTRDENGEIGLFVHGTLDFQPSITIVPSESTTRLMTARTPF